MKNVDFVKLHNKINSTYLYSIIIDNIELTDDNIIYIALIGLLKNNPNMKLINVYNLYNYICSELNNISQQIEILLNVYKPNIILSIFCIPNIENEIKHDLYEIRLKMFSFFNNNPEFIMENFNKYKENVNKFVYYINKNNFLL